MGLFNGQDRRRIAVVVTTDGRRANLPLDDAGSVGGVDSAEEHRQDAEDAGIEVESFVDAANTLAVFLWGPDGIRIEYVEHKPTFSLT